jgi:hypothetical protein
LDRDAAKRAVATTIARSLSDEWSHSRQQKEMPFDRV